MRKSKLNLQMIIMEFCFCYMKLSLNWTKRSNRVRITTISHTNSILLFGALNKYALKYNNNNKMTNTGDNKIKSN